MASGGMVLVKYLLFFFNFIFWISGICLIAIGAWVKAKYGDFTHVSAGDLTTGPVFLIIIGVIVSFIGFLGCCGAYKENYCMVTTFAISLGVIFILQIAAGAYAYSKRKELDHYAKKGLENAVNEYSKEEYQKAMDHVQEEFDCCGASGYEDYLRSRVSNSTKFPKSCCRNQTVCPDDFLAARRANKTVFVTEGCVKAVESYFHDHFVVVGGVGVGIAFIQVIGIVFACCLMRSIKKEYEVM